MGNKFGLIMHTNSEAEEELSSKIEELDRKIDLLESLIIEVREIKNQLKRVNESRIFPFAEELYLEAFKEKVYASIKMEQEHNPVYVLTEEDRKLISCNPEIKQIFRDRNYSLDNSESPMFLSIGTQEIENSENENIL